MNSLNDSCREGRDSWLVNLVFGKIEDAVVAAKLCLHSAELFLGLAVVF